MKKQILLSASLFHAMTDAASVITPMVFPILYSRQFLITRYSQIGFLSNVGLLLTFVVQFFVVHLSFRHEYRWLMIGSGLGICVSTALIPFSGTFGGLLALFLLLRVFGSFYHPIIIAWVSKSRSGSGRELDDAMGVQSGSGNAGVFLAFVSVGFLAQRWNWKVPFYVWAALSLCLGILGMRTIRGISSMSGRPPRLDARSWIHSLAGIAKYVPGFFLGGMGWSVTVYFAPSLLNHKFGIPMGQTGLYLALWIGLGTITGYGYGVWSRRFGRKRVFLFSLAGAALSLFVIGFASHRTLAIAGLLAFGGFLLMTYPSLHTFVGSTVPPAGQTQAFSWVSNVQLVSGAVVTLAAGFLSDSLGIHFPFILSGILTLAIFLYYLPRSGEYFGGGAGGPADVGPDGL